MRWIPPAAFVALHVVLGIAACGDDEAMPTSSKPAGVGQARDGGSTSSGAADGSDAGSTPVTPAVDAGAGGDDDDDATEEEDDRAGDATYYTPGTTGACGIKTPSDKLVGALGPALYSKDHCGQCATVTGPKGSVTVLLNERCGGCKGESMDLSPQAFTQIADKSAGRVKITWHFTDCE